MTSRAIAFAVAAILLHYTVSLLIHRFGWTKENFRKTSIPAVYGLYIVSYGTVAAIASLYLQFSSASATQLYLIAIITFGLLGLADDTFGTREVGGFGGHFRKLLLERTLTTGALKAIGGGLMAVYLAYRTSGGVIWLWALDFAIIALAANTVNLLDLRPGRAITAFFFGMIVTVACALGRISDWVTVGIVVLATMAVGCYDCRGRAMLGDVGSNTLGAVLGLTIVLDVPMVGKLTAAAVFLAINIYAEKCSISKTIEGHPLLARIDRRLGVR